MKRIIASSRFRKWFNKLKDIKAQAQIAKRISRLSYGNYGDYKILGGGLLELRIDIGPGYRVYFFEHDKDLVILVLGGNKGSQKKDIDLARTMMVEYENEN